MRTITITKNVYKFEELSKDVQEKIADNNFESYPVEFITENMEYQLEDTIFSNPQISWSLSHYQGDGVSFKADIDTEDMLEKCYPELKRSVKNAIINNVVFKSKGAGGSNSFVSRDNIAVGYDYPQTYDLFDALIETIQLKISKIYVDLCIDLEKIGYDEIEYQSSIENAQENADENEYEYYENGELI